MNDVDATSLLFAVAAAEGAMVLAGTVRSLRVPCERRLRAHSPNRTPSTAALAAAIPENEPRKETT